MNLKLFLNFTFWILLLFSSCRKEDFSFNETSQNITVSTDTIILDTVYNGLRSSTYTLKIFNKENKDVRIPKIFLGQGENSQYKINVDGKAGYNFENIPIRANDSLFVFIEIAPNIHTKELVAEDYIGIQTAFSQQKVTLLSVIQDAEFIISTPDNPKIIQNDTNWDNSKVKILLGEIQLAEGKTLSISKGSKIYFMQNSGLKINKNAILNINGDLNEEVIFRGHRNEPKYDTLPKNWEGIQLEEGSTLNINYAKIFGGTTGLYLNNASATIKNTIIHTFQDYGIFAINTTLNAQNLVMNNAGIANIGIVKGGNYNITHSTLANYWKLSQSSALVIHAQNYWTNSNGSIESSPLSFSFKNSIAYNQKNNAIKFISKNNIPFNYYIENSLIKYSSDAGFIWDNNSYIINSLANINPMFINYYTKNMNLNIANNSPIKGKANPTTAQSVPLDIKKVNRTNSPTIGAYQ